MAHDPVQPWFGEFLVEPDGRPDEMAIWTGSADIPATIRKPTRAEKLSIVLIGVFAIGWIVVMAVTLAVAVYISRH